MISPSRDGLQLFLHVLAATIWVGGQLTLATALCSIGALLLGVLLAG